MTTQLSAADIKPAVDTTTANEARAASTDSVARRLRTVTFAKPVVKAEKNVKEEPAGPTMAKWSERKKLPERTLSSTSTLDAAAKAVAKTAAKPIPAAVLIPGLRHALSSYQLKTCERMGELERGSFNGGVLCAKAEQSRMALVLAHILKQESDSAFSECQRGTLIVTANETEIGQWEKAMVDTVKYGVLTMLRHHGKSRLSDCDMDCCDIVVTTWKMLSDAKEESPLFSDTWGRVIVDQHTTIKRENAKANAAYRRLDVDRRWFVNEVPDKDGMKSVANIYKFMEIPIPNCVPSSSSHMAYFEKFMVGQIGGGSDVPGVEVKMDEIRIELSSKQREAYDMFTELLVESANISTCLARTAAKTHVSTALAQRRFIVHPMVEMTVPVKERFNDLTAHSSRTYDDLVDGLAKFVGKYKPRNPHTLEGTRTSPKISKIVSTLRAERKSDENMKAVVCVDSIRAMEIVDDHLRRAGFTTYKYSGEIAAHLDTAPIECFKKSTKSSVLISTPRISESTLDLSCASVVVLDSPWWLEGRSKGCISSVANSNQTRPVVKVFTIHAVDTVDDRIKSQNNSREEQPVKVKLEPGHAVAASV